MTLLYPAPSAPEKVLGAFAFVARDKLDATSQFMEPPFFQALDDQAKPADRSTWQRALFCRRCGKAGRVNDLRATPSATLQCSGIP